MNEFHVKSLVKQAPATLTCSILDGLHIQREIEQSLQVMQNTVMSMSLLSDQ